MSDFGYKEIAPSSITTDDYISGAIYACSESGTGQSITVYIRDFSAAGGKCKCALYKASDNSFVAETEEKDAPLTSGWNTFNFVNGPALTAQNYWILVWANVTCTVRYQSGGSTTLCWTGLTYGNWPNPLVPDEYANYDLSIYCTYQAAQPVGRSRAFIIS